MTQVLEVCFDRFHATIPGRVAIRGRPLTAPSEPCVRFSPHTALPVKTNNIWRLCSPDIVSLLLPPFLYGINVCVSQYGILYAVAVGCFCYLCLRMSVVAYGVHLPRY